MLACEVLSERLGVWHLCSAYGTRMDEGLLGRCLLIAGSALLLGSLLGRVLLLGLNFLLSSCHGHQDSGPKIVVEETGWRETERDTPGLLCYVTASGINGGRGQGRS